MNYDLIWFPFLKKKVIKGKTNADLKREKKDKKTKQTIISNNMKLYHDNFDCLFMDDFGDEYKDVLNKSDVFLFTRERCIFQLAQVDQYRKMLESIYDRFEKYIKNNNRRYSNLENCHRNIIGVTLSPSFEELEEDDLRTGCYNMSTNIITLFENMLKSFGEKKHVLAHEFLHMASTKDEEACGFHLRNLALNDGSSIPHAGKGINEGYTELLTCRIFPDEDFEDYSYPYNVRIVKMIELLFDDNRDMENAYFNNDLGTVYLKFCEYGSMQEFLKVLTNLDLIIELKGKDVREAIFEETRDLMYDIIKRTGSCDKVNACEKIIAKDIPVIKYRAKRVLQKRSKARKK